MRAEGEAGGVDGGGGSGDGEGAAGGTGRMRVDAARRRFFVNFYSWIKKKRSRRVAFGYNSSCLKRSSRTFQKPDPQQSLYLGSAVMVRMSTKNVIAVDRRSSAEALRRISCPV